MSSFPSDRRTNIGPDWEYDYETFVEFDAAGREQAAAKYKIWQAAYEKFWSARDNSAAASEASPIYLSKHRK